jgi:hypothetical protein
MHLVYFKHPDSDWILYHKCETAAEAVSMGRALTDLDYEVKLDQDVSETSHVN